MPARFIIDDRTGALYSDFTAREKVSASSILSTEQGLTTEVQVYSLTVPTDGSAVSTATLTDADLDLIINRVDRPQWVGELGATYNSDASGKIDVENLTASSLQAALNSIDDVQSDGGVEVKAAGDGYLITLKTNGAATSTPGLDVEDLQPPASVSVSVVQTGDSDTRAAWALRILPSPVAEIAGGSWSAESDGSYNGLKANLSLASTALIAALRDNDVPMEISINHSGERLHRGKVTISDNLDPSGLGAPAALVYARLVNGDALSTPRAPTVNDDIDLGYGVGSVWVYDANTYFLVDNTADAADWNAAGSATGAWTVEESFPSTSGVAGSAGEIAASGNQIAVYNGSAWVYFEGFSK